MRRDLDVRYNLHDHTIVTMYFSFDKVDKPISSDSITSTADLLLVLSNTVPYTTMGITDVVDSNNTINGIVLENYPDISLHHIEYAKN